MSDKIQFDTTLNNTGFISGTKELARMVKSLESTVIGVGRALKGSFSGYTMSAYSAAKASKEIEAEIRQLEKESAKLRAAFGRGVVDSTAYIELKKEIRDAQKYLEGFNKAQAKYDAKGIPKRVEEWKDAQQDAKDYEKVAQEASDKVTEAYNKYQEIRAKYNGKGYEVQKAKIAYEYEQSMQASAIRQLADYNDRVEMLRRQGYEQQAKQYEDFLKERETAQNKLAELENKATEMTQNGTAYTRTEETKAGQQLIEQQRAIDERIKTLREINDSLRARVKPDGAFDFLREAPYKAPKPRKGETIDADAESKSKELNSLNEEYRSAVVNLNALLEKQRQLLGEGASGGTEWIQAYNEGIKSAQERITELQSELSDLKTLSGGELDAGLAQSYEDEIAKLEALIADYKEEIEGIQAGGEGGQSTAVWEENIADIEAATERVAELRAQMESLGALEVDPMKEIKLDLAESMLALKKLEVQKEALAARHAAGDESSTLWGVEEEQLKSLDEQIEKTEQHIADLREKLAVQPKEEKVDEQPKADESTADSMRAVSDAIRANIGLWERLPAVSKMAGTAISTALAPVLHPVQALDHAIGGLISGVGRLIGTLARMAGNGALSFLRKLASGARNAAIQLAKLASGAVVGGLRKIAQGAATAGKGILGMFKHTKRANSGFKTSLKTILKYAFGVRSMYFLFRRLRNAVKEAFNELAKYDPQVKASIDGLKTALNGLKGSLATAFAPILTAIAPALIRLMNMLTQAMNTIGAFGAALSGKAFFKKAVGGLNNTGKAAGNASKKAKELKRQLAGFDELNILNDNDNGGGGGGGSGSGFTYKTEKIADGIQNFVKTLKELWKNGEYEKIGRLVGAQVNKLFSKAYKAVRWSNIKKKWKKALDAITGIFNGLIKSIDWNLIGRTISEGFNSLVNIVDGLINRIDFGAAGTALANAFNGLFSKPELFTNAATALSNGIKGILKFGQYFLEGFEEENVAAGIRDALENGIDWSGIAESTWAFITKAFSKAGNFLNVLLGGESKAKVDPVKAVGAAIQQGKSPNEAIEGVLSGKFKALSYDGVWTELADNLAKGFNTAVDKLTEFINSFSVRDAVSALADWIAKFIGGIHFENVGMLLGHLFRQALDGISAAIESFSENATHYGTNIAKAINGFLQAAFDGDTIANTFTNLVKSAFSFLSAFLEKLDEEHIAEELRKAIEGVDWDGIAKAAWNAFKLAVSKLGNFLTILFGGEVEHDPSDVVGEAIRAGKSYQEAIEEANRKRNGYNGQETSAAGLAHMVGNAVTTILGKLSEWLANIPWTEWGDKIHTFLINLPWEDMGDKLAKALKELFSGLDDLIAVSIYGENYKENKTWQALHPQKYAKYQREQYFAEHPERQATFERTGLSKVDWLTEKQKSVLAVSQSDAKQMGGLNRDTMAQVLTYVIAEAGAAYESGDWEKAAQILGDLRTLQPEFFEEQKEWMEAILRFDVDDLLTGGLKKDSQDVLGPVNELINVAKQLQEMGYSADEIIGALASNDVEAQLLRAALVENTLAVASNTEITDNLNKPEHKNYVGKTEEEYKHKYPGIFIPNLEKDGSEIANGLKKGVEDKQGELNQTMVDTADGMNTAFEDEEGISSPSTVFEQYGKYIVDGLVLGLSTLRGKLDSFYNDLPAWAQALLGQAYSGFKLSLSGGVGGGAENPESVEDSTKATRRETKEVKKLTKEVKANTKKRKGVDIDFEGTPLAGDGTKVTVGVEFAPEGEEPTDDNTNSGLLGWLQAILDSGVTVQAAVEMVKRGWSDFLSFLGLKTDNPTIGTLIKLIKDNFDSVMSWLGIGPDSPIATLIKLLLDNADSILDFLGIDENVPIKTVIQLVLNKFKDLLDFLGIPEDSPIRTFIDLLMGNTDPEAKEVLDSDGSEVTIFALLQKALGSKTPAELFGTLLTILATVLRASGLNVNSALNLFNWLKSVVASGVGRSVGKNAVLDLFGWAKSVVANGAGRSVEKGAVLGLFTWSKKVLASAVGRDSGVNRGDITGLFNWTKKVIASAVGRDPTLKRDGITGLFNWGKKVVANAVGRDGSKVKEGSVLGLFTWNKGVTATKPSRANNVQADAAINLFTQKLTIEVTPEKCKDWDKKIGKWSKVTVTPTTPNAAGGVIRNGILHRFASGGIISGGIARYLSAVPHYAAGTSKAHGTVFVAGEAGPEIMGHINGRTEILNKAQIAEAIYGAVVSGMAQAVNALGTYLANHMTNCTNAIVQTIGANAGLSGIRGLDYYAPAMASGGIVPYDVAMQIARSTTEIQNTLDSNNDELIQAITTAVGSAATSIVQVLQQQLLQNRANYNRNAGVGGTDEINRLTLMFGKSPLAGV